MPTYWMNPENIILILKNLDIDVIHCMKYLEYEKL